MRYEIVGTVRDWTFYEVTNHGFTGELADKPLYGFVVGEPEISGLGGIKFGELYPSLDHALVAAVGEKYTGQRGAGGTGVDTAAGWFMRMIGAGQLVPAENARLVLTGAAQVAGLVGPWSGSGISVMDAALKADGYTLARVNTGS